MSSTIDLHRRVLSLLEQRCTAYHAWETAFRKVLASTTPDDVATATASFQQTSQAAASSISNVSVALREIAASGSEQHGCCSPRTAKWIVSIQQHEKQKFESTVALQKQVMQHMRGDGCATFVHEDQCAVYDLCFGFICGTALASVTAGASMLERRRVTAAAHLQQQQRGKRTIDASSDDNDDEADGNGKVQAEHNQVPPQRRDCNSASVLVSSLLERIRACEDAVSEITLELQAEVTDAQS